MQPSDLKGSQLVVAQATTTPDCLLYAYEKTDSGWVPVDGMCSVPGKTGKKGVGPHPGWWHWTTPTGYFGLGPAMGAAAYEETGLPYHQIVPGDYWVEDRASKYYNKFYQESWNDKDWNGAEDLYATLKVYYYCIVIQFNMDPISTEEDCAIFFHVKNPDTEDGTGGCVSAEEWYLRAMFRWLDESRDPHILIY